MQKKFIVFILILLFQVQLAQQSYTFNPNWEIGKVYQLQSESFGYQIKENNRKFHEFDNSYIIELKLISRAQDKNIFSWKIKQSNSKNPNHIRMVDKLAYFDGIEFIFTTDTNNKYIELRNLHEIKRKVREKLTPKTIREFSKKSKDRDWTQTYLEKIYKDPSYEIAMIEKQIINYFKFYGVEISAKDIETRRVLSPIGSMVIPELPYKIFINISQNLDTKVLNIVSNLDTKKFTSQDWENANFLRNQSLEKLKKLFNITFQERYTFNSEDRVSEMLILYSENNLHNNSKLLTFSQTVIKLIE